MSDVLKVTVKAGLSFSCPYCQSVGYRAAPGSDVFAPPYGHQVIGDGPKVAVRCFVRRKFGRDWLLEFADSESNQERPGHDG